MDDDIIRADKKEDNFDPFTIDREVVRVEHLVYSTFMKSGFDSFCPHVSVKIMFYAKKFIIFSFN